MGRIVIVAYRPKPGRQKALAAAVAKHMRVLRAQQLVTARDAYVMQSSDGTVIEAFEWRSADAIAQAHTNPAVQELWAEFGDACDYIPLRDVREAQQMFAEFEPLRLPDEDGR